LSWALCLFASRHLNEFPRRLFNSIAPHYDELNGILSLGQHWFWKQQTAKSSGVQPGHKVLDVCCGSGDIAILLAKLVGSRGEVIGLDFAAAMLEDAARRSAAQKLQIPGLEHLSTPIQWIQGDATALPFPDEAFDAVTMGYGLRNVDNRPLALQELRRVLKPGAKAAILDFNNSRDATVDSVQEWALKNVVVPAAKIYDLEEEYAYLRPSIKAFPTGKEQEEMAISAGFSKAEHTELAFGLMGLLVCQR
jgi:ubiquinone/menaquinone biosynthesis methyltransferase